MANPMKGESIVRVEAGEFTLAFTLGACIAIQDQCGGKPFQQVLAEMEKTQDLRLMCVVLWAGLRKHHSLSLEEVGDLVILSEASLWGQAVGRAINDPEAGKGENPRKAKAG
jgi:hypothetical protein